MTSRNRDAVGKNVKVAYQNRPTFADYVTQNMALLNRNTYFQRIVYLSKHLSTDNDFNTKLIQTYEMLLSKCRENSFDERLAGLILIYDGFSIVMLEGPGEIIAIFLNSLSEFIDELFQNTIVNLIVNNIYQLFFDRIVWRKGKSPILMAKLMSVELNDIKSHNKIILGKLYKLCTKISESIEQKDETYALSELSPDYNIIIPVIARMEIVLDSDRSITLKEYIKLISTQPIYEDYGLHVWPYPYDNIPSEIFEVRKHDVNLTFKDNIEEFEDDKEKLTISAKN